MPAGYMLSSEPGQVELHPVRTTVVDFAARAMRSVAGRVLLRDDGGRADRAPALRPATGVTVVAAGRTSRTDADGRFLLRDLPAGEVRVTMTVERPVPPGRTLPSGLLRLPHEPIHVPDAVIVIGSALAAALGVE